MPCIKNGSFKKVKLLKIKCLFYIIIDIENKKGEMYNVIYEKRNRKSNRENW